MFGLGSPRGAFDFSGRGTGCVQDDGSGLRCCSYGPDLQAPEEGDHGDQRIIE